MVSTTHHGADPADSFRDGRVIVIVDTARSADGDIERAFGPYRGSAGAADDDSSILAFQVGSII